jgi:hypothetical protein
MTSHQIASLPDEILIASADEAAARSRSAVAELIRVLIEVERRRLHLALGYSSMFAYCTTRLKLSEAAAYSRITAARAARQFLAILPMLEEGALTLAGLSRLAAHLTRETAEHLLSAARFKSTRDIERLVASIHAQPDVPAAVRKAPPPRPSEIAEARTSDAVASDMFDSGAGRADRTVPPADAHQTTPVATARTSVIAPIAPTRYLLRITIAEHTHTTLERLRALLRHRVPNGDPAAIVDLALAVLLERTERERCGRALRVKGERQRRAEPASGRGDNAKSRHVPATIRRQVWERDAGRCAFVGTDGRCAATGFLEIHHVEPFAAGGRSTVDNLELRCRAHNNYEARLFFGDREPRPPVGDAPRA